MDAEQITELCYTGEDELKQRFEFFIGSILYFQNRISELEDDLSTALDVKFTCNSVIDGYWGLYDEICDMDTYVSKYHYSCIRQGYAAQYDIVYDAISALKDNTAFYICTIMEHFYPGYADPLTKPMERRIINHSSQSNKELKKRMLKLNSIKL